jgi:DNA-binding transcriptional ArsR family regulator
MEKDKIAGYDIRSLARRLKACGHPVRLRLLCAIETGDPCVSDLSACVDESQPVVSQHLAVLKKEGIVESRVKGNRRIYSISDPVIKGILRSMRG